MQDIGELRAEGLFHRGCMGLSQSCPPFPDKKEAISFLRRALELVRESKILHWASVLYMSAAYVEVPNADWDKLEQRVSGIQICGKRYAPAMLKMTGQ